MLVPTHRVVFAIRGEEVIELHGPTTASTFGAYRGPKEFVHVPTYILLSTLSPHGVGTLKANPQRLLEVNDEIAQMGAKVVQQWAVLGPYDFVNIVEAPDEKVIARVSVELAARGTAHFQTLTAIPVDEFLSLLK